MAKSLQDQLIQAGLASEEQKKRGGGGKKRKPPKARKKDRAQGTAELRDETPSKVELNAIAKAERDRELNRKRQADLARREAVGQIRQLIETSRVKLENGDVEYNFADGKTIRKLAMAAAMHADLTEGRLAIAKLDGGFHMIPRVVADKIVEQDAGFIVVLNDRDAANTEDDEYADYKIPDDLMW